MTALILTCHDRVMDKYNGLRLVEKPEPQREEPREDPKAFGPFTVEMIEGIAKHLSYLIR